MLELIAPGAFMLWLGLSAMLVGIISFFVAGRGSTSSSPSRCSRSPRSRCGGASRAASSEQVDQPFLNRRADAFVGREFTLEKPIVAGNGTVKIDDTIWRLSGPDVPGGSRVKVVRADAATLVVEPRSLSFPHARSRTACA